MLFNTIENAYKRNCWNNSSSFNYRYITFFCFVLVYFRFCFSSISDKESMDINNMETTTFMQSNQQQSATTNNKNKKKKKCRGNRKLQHFKRKCRSRGMTEEQIIELINSRNNNIVSNTNIPMKKKEKQKRKRFERNNEENNTTIRSINQLSISHPQQEQPLSKRLKTNQEENNTTSIRHNSKK